ncbi:alpha/beta hydrolase [Candidatus Poribacteria bacterium]|nr:alpha/beta hydrolase [Candidatus Poribacteria bacterium]
MKIDKQTYTFKVVENCEIKADVYGVSDDVIHPVIVWIHGGALIVGHRENINPEHLNLYVSAGYTLVSIDYRLAPETKLKAIIDDLQDAYGWVREKGPELFNIDANRIAVIGHSAGGYLALMTGFCVAPRPKALVSFYGYGDITGNWYSRPDPFYCQQPPVPKEEAYEAVGDSVISEATGQHNRGRFYLYCRQNGLWPKEVAGRAPDTEPRAFDPFCPIRNVTREYPPTLLLHGDRDTDVPYQQSVMMADELARVGVEHELITIKNGGHGFDGAGIKEPVVANAFEQVLDFLKNQVKYQFGHL